MKKVSNDGMESSYCISNVSKAKGEIAVTTVDEPVVETAASNDRIVAKATSKQKLSVDEQIKYLKYKGITFNHCSEQLAKEVLSKRTYYYKVTAFRKNFSKNENKN